MTQKYYPPEHRDAVCWIPGRPIAPVGIPVEFPPRDPLPVSDQQGVSVRVLLLSSPRHDGARDGARDSLSWLLDAKLSNPCALNFRGTPSVGLQARIPIRPEPTLPTICLKLVYSYNSSENEEKLQCCRSATTCGEYTYAQCNNLSSMLVRKLNLYRRKKARVQFKRKALVRKVRLLKPF